MTTQPLDVTLQTGLSLSEGPPVQDAPSRLVSLASALRDAAARSPQLGVRYLNSDGSDRFQTYPELVSEASRMLGGLRAAGLRPGEKILFQLHRNEDFLSAFWACAFGGFVPVPISIPPGYDEMNGTLAKLQNAWTMLDSPVVLASDALVSGLNGFAGRQGLAGFRVLPVSSLRLAAPDSAWHDNRPDDLALLLLTSGSTGQPKGVQLTHHNILARSAATVQADGFGAHDVSLNWMPLDHVGGIVMFHLRDVYAACSQIQASTDLVLQNPLTWLDWVQKYRVSITWAPNFAFGLINDQADNFSGRVWDLSSLRFILNGGEAIVSRTARRFLELLAVFGLPATAMRPAWGMSETSSGVTSSALFSAATTSDADPFVEVGPPLPGVSIRIVDRQGALVPAGTIGSLQIRGLTITSGYYNNPELNAEVFTSDGWFITGDLGVLKEGRLTITGREKDVIIVNGVNFHSHELEAAAEEVAGVDVSFTAACAIRMAGENTDRIALFFSPAPSFADRLPALIKAIRAAVVKKEGVNPDYVLPLAKDAVPKTAIGKIQRSLLKQQFERGDFAALIRQFSTSADTASTPAWFYQPRWLERPPAAGALSAGASFWLFADSAGPAREFSARLVSAGHPCTIIEPGPAFARTAPSIFQVSPGDPADYERLVAAVGGVPDCIIHAFTYGHDDLAADAQALEKAQARGAYSLLGLVKALTPAGAGGRSMRLLVVSTRTRSVLPADPVSYAKTPLLGLVRTIPQELAWLDCRHVDLEPGTAELFSRHVFAELQSWSGTLEAAWRGDTRFVPCLGVAAPAPTPRPLPFVRGGLYLISGGIGGIGLRIAAHLLQHFDARLLIVGRSPLAPRAEQAAVLAAGGSAADRVRAYQSLELLGGAFDYVQADVADGASMEAVLRRAEEKWGRPLDGVFHLAGVYQVSLLENETIAGLSAHLRPKVSGTWALHQLALHRPGCLFVNFSSLISYFGSLTTGAYAAANAFLNAFSQYQREACGLRAYNILWSSWTAIGMSRGFDATEALRARGYFAITPEQGIESLLYTLRNDHAQLLVGVDGSSKAMKPYLDPAVVSAAAAETPAGGETAYEAPRTEVERQIALIWQEILGLPRVGRTDHFFDLGGRSLLAAKMFAKINKTLGKNLPIPALFNAPTLAQLATVFLEQPKSSAVKINALQPSGSRPPFFLIPGPGTDGSVFQDLAQKLGTDQPCFGLQAKSLASAETSAAPLALEETAVLFAEEILALVPSGPCALGGRGFGGVLAWETARVLKAKGRQVALIALLDAPPAGFFSREGGSSQLRFIKPASSGGFLGKLFKKNPPEDASITKELRQARERYGDLTLTPAAVPVTIVGESTAQIWRDFSPSGFSQLSENAWIEKLPQLLAK